MGFAINPSMNHLDIPEKCILEIHQSTAEVLLPDARFRGHPCEAYICISRVEAEMRAYVAVLNTALKSTLVYTSDFVASAQQDYPRVFAEAEEFVKAMGFTMQKINLDFSPAMREVIIRGLRVMRPPAPQKRPPVRPLKIDVPNELIVSTGLEIVTPTDETGATTELLSLRAELASARSALELVTREKVAADQLSASERAKLKASCEQAMESRRLAEERLTQAMRELKRLQQAPPPRKDDAELSRLLEQITRLEVEKNLLEERLAAAATQLSALQVEEAAKQQLENQLEAARAAGAEAAEKLAAMAGLEREARQREEALRRQAESAGNDLAAARAELEELRRRIAEANDALAAAEKEYHELIAASTLTEESRHRLAAAEAELAEAREQLAAANAALEQRSWEREQMEELLHRVAAAEAELTRVRGDLRLRDGFPTDATAAGDRPTGDELARLAEEKAAVEAEYVRLATESRETEATLSENLSQAEAEIERLASELEIQAQVAAMEQAALRAELRRLIVEGGAAFYTQPPVAQAAPLPPAAQAPPATPTPAPSPREAEPPPASDEEVDEAPDAPIAGDDAIMHAFTSDLGGFYGGGGASTAQFRIDPAIDAITYRDPAEVIAVFYSSNSVQAVPDGKGIQRCKGYIVATKGDEGYRVHVAWHLTESGRVVVCLPDQQPSDSDECVQILRDAVTYFEIVGFMMEIADLGTTRRSYRRSLKKIPVLKKVPL